MAEADEFGWLAELAAAVTQASQVRQGEKVGPHGPNTTGHTLIRPGGRDCYPAFWVRDYAMSLESGLIGVEEQRHALRLTAALQQAEDWHTPSGSLVPRGAIADHITFGGRPIFFPGTLDDYEGQGGRWGRLPSLDDHFFFVEMAWRLVVQHGEKDLLGQPVAGLPLLDRLDLAFAVPPSRPDTGLVWCDEQNRGVSFGFVDSICHTGELLHCSLLKNRAARHLAQLHQLQGNPAAARRYQALADTLGAAIPATFADAEGWLRASTGKSRQPDVWGSALAVYEGLVDAPTRQRLSALLCQAYTCGALSWRGAVRHVPVGKDHRRHSAWEQTVSSYPRNRYQNGAYWSTPTGWVCFALAQVSPRIGRQLALELIAALREGDFRQGAAWGAPFECAHPEGGHQQNPVYLTSVTCPLAAFRRLGWVG